MFRPLYMILYIFIFLITICLLILFLPGPLDKDVLFTIKKGQDTVVISKELANEDIIRNRYFFAITMRLLGLDKKIVVGEFPIFKGANLVQIIRTIIDSRKIYFRKITIPEGLTVKEIYQILNNNPYLTGDLPKDVLEGSLLPDTYYFAKDETRVNVVNRMHQHMVDYINELWRNRDKSLPYNFKEEAITLASMIEKETAISSEKKLIAGVFLNRLHLKMRLQSDPTVAYGLQLLSAKSLTKKHLLIKTPYNTYKKLGLPIGPIANPGKESIEAVFYPVKTKYLYFVADGKGGHIFSSTLEDHNKAVLALRKIEKKILINRYSYKK